MFRGIRPFNQPESYEGWYKEPLGEYVLKAELKGLDLLLPKSGLGADFGAGTGIFAEHLMTEDRTILCVDPAVKMLSNAQKRGLQTVLGVAEYPPIKHQSLDFIYLVAVIEFLDDPIRALSSLKDLLKKGSPIIVLMINRESPWGEAYIEAGERGDPIFSYASFYTLKEVMGFLKEAEYALSEVIGTLIDPPTVIPNRSPPLVKPGERPDAGVFLVKGIKI